FKTSFHVYLIAIDDINCIILLHNRSLLLNYQPFFSLHYPTLCLRATGMAAALNLALLSPENMA
ncbi:hypothetical protein PAS25_05200, partial [Leclercia adecarboxylata]|uniref:hypothetical protein n=1 Tax=Leclercia adecarboxylata TaxID=83655 RepID=UPI003133E029